MPRYRNALPQLGNGLFVTDGGLETVLIFHEGFDLPQFAAFVLLDSRDGREALARYYRAYADLARDLGLDFLLESMTYRASDDWGEKLGLDAEQVAEANRRGIRFLETIRDDYDDVIGRIVISGCMGPRFSGYHADERMTADEAAEYHRVQIATLGETEADLVSAYTLPYADEGVGVALAARDVGMPAVISFTVETDGCLPSGETLREAIERVDEVSDGSPAYYMVNCAHPTHFVGALDGDAWTDRIRAVRANASARSHAELDESPTLDEGDPAELARGHLDLADRLKYLTVIGGCCGTDHRHVGRICRMLAGRD
jgi:S-methylmethionine-dependent homocysteine/selenocysteine methylase